MKNLILVVVVMLFLLVGCSSVSDPITVLADYEVVHNDEYSLTCWVYPYYKGGITCIPDWMLELPSHDDYLHCANEETCIHKIGHWMDVDLDYPSHSDEFRQELDNYAENCIVDSNTGFLSDDVYCGLVKNFPGVNGNPPIEGHLTGYSEAYAQLYNYKVYRSLRLTGCLDRFFTTIWQAYWWDETPNTCE